MTNGSAKTTQNLPFATDEECAELRQRLVRAGKIVPAKPDGGGQAKPAPRGEEFVPFSPAKRRNANDIPEEGVYKVRRIRSDEEYERRKRSYFIMLQSVLRTREELHLEFGERDEEEIDGEA